MTWEYTKRSLRVIVQLQVNSNGNAYENNELELTSRTFELGCECSNFSGLSRLKSFEPVLYRLLSCCFSFGLCCLSSGGVFGGVGCSFGRLRSLSIFTLFTEDDVIVVVVIVVARPTKNNGPEDLAMGRRRLSKVIHMNLNMLTSATIRVFQWTIRIDNHQTEQQSFGGNPEG